MPTDSLISANKKVILLLGPTGVGKTEVSILLAERLNTEIISADSMQIYRYMDIGTAKPTPIERSMVKHHMIDIIDPWESYSAGKYISSVAPVFEDIQRQGKIPLVVGGTGLYIKAMTRGIFSGPSADWRLRNELLSYEAYGKGILYEQLQKLDAEAAKKITPNDTRRIVRALEVIMQSSKRISQMQKNLTRPLQYSFLKIGLTRDRNELYEMIEKRVDSMIASGLVDEVRNINNMISTKLDAGFSHPSHPLPALQAIGYKEIAQSLRGEMSLDRAVSLIKRASRRYAKRQFTWFRREDDIKWIDITGIFSPPEVLVSVDRMLTELL